MFKIVSSPKYDPHQNGKTKKDVNNQWFVIEKTIREWASNYGFPQLPTPWGSEGFPPVYVGRGSLIAIASQV